MKKIALALIMLVSTSALAETSKNDIKKEVQIIKCTTERRDDLIDKEYSNPLWGQYGRVKQAKGISCQDSNGKKRLYVVSAVVDFGFDGDRQMIFPSYINSREQVVFTKTFMGDNNDFIAALMSSTKECPTKIFVTKKAYGDYDFAYGITCDILD